MGKPADHRPIHDLQQLRERITQRPELDAVLGWEWLEDEYRRPFRNWSLVTGWLNSDEAWASDWLGALDQTLRILRGLPEANWQVVQHKVRAHCTRNQFKSVLSELCIFSALFRAGCQLDFEQTLISGSDLDVDVTASLPGTGTVVHLEVYQISPSEGYLRELEVSGQYNEFASTDFDREGKRIQNKIWRKARKFPENALCLVAIDYTLFPEMGTGRTSLTAEIIGGVWKWKGMQKKLTGVLAFQMDSKTMQPIECHAMIGAFTSDQRELTLIPFLESLGAYISIYQPSDIR